MSRTVFDVDNFKDQIPYYLTRPQKEGLIEALKDFPNNTQYYLGNYSNDLKQSVLQGDIFHNLTVYSIQGEKKLKGIILSNSCDIDTANKRDIPARALFAPLVSIAKFVNLLERNGVSKESITSKINDVRNQQVTNMVYLPQNDKFEESVVFLDDIYQLQATELRKLLDNQCKLVTLSQVGFYILLFKISIHFCRFHEDVQRYEH